MAHFAAWAGPNWAARGAAVGLLLAHTALLSWGATRHSPTWVEVGQLPAGLSHLLFGRFDLYCVNPPLVRTVAAVPLLFDRPETNWASYSIANRSEFAVGSDFLEANAEQSHWYFVLGRWACIPFSLLGGYICWRWARELYGTLSGLLSLTLWCFCPNVLASGQMITCDSGGAALGICAAYLFWRWLQCLTWERAVIAGVVMGLAVLTKSTWLVLFGLWPLLFCICSFMVIRPGTDSSRLRGLGQCGVMLLLALLVLNLGYCFEGFGTTLGSFRFSSLALGGATENADSSTNGMHNRFEGTWLARLPVPLPINFVRGIDLQKSDFEANKPMYLAGEWKRGGWWYYYLYALAIKVPLGTWCLFITSLGIAWTRKMAVVDAVVLLAPAVAILLLVSSQTGINKHVRYALPALPFIYVWCGQVAPFLLSGSWMLKVPIGLALIWSVGSSLAIYPNSLSYFNELAGGPKRGHEHLVSSNIDWGQDLLYLKEWLHQHPEAKPLRLSVAGIVDPKLYGIHYEPALGNKETGSIMPTRFAPGWYVISVERLHSPSGAFLGFLRLKPVAMAGYSIYIYHVDEDAANSLERQRAADAKWVDETDRAGGR